MAEKDTMNREIAEALTALGLDEGLAWEGWQCTLGHIIGDDGQCESSDGCHANVLLRPHDFTDARYLEKAIDAYCDETGHGYTVQRFF